MSAHRYGRRRDLSERAIPIEAGQVICPRKGILDIEACWVCPEYRGLSDGHVESLICGLSEESLASVVWAIDRPPIAGH